MSNSVASVLDKYIDEYLEETGSPFTKVEVYEMVEHLLPINNDVGVPIGMLGLSVFNSEKFKERVPVLKLLYIEKDARTPGSFNKVVTDIFVNLKKQGFKRVEVLASRPVNNWFKKKAKSRPVQFAHLQEIDYLLDNLTNKES